MLYGCRWRREGAVGSAVGGGREGAPALDLALPLGEAAEDRVDRIGAGDVAQRRLRRRGQLDQRGAELLRIAGLAVIVAAVGRPGLGRERRVVGNRPGAVAHRAAVEEVGAEETRLDDGDLDAEI